VPVKVLVVAVVALGLHCTVLAGPVTEVMLSAQPQQFTKEGAIDGCGVRLVGIAEPVPRHKKVPVFDVSFNVVNPSGGIVKGGLMDLPVQAMLKGDLNAAVEVPIKNLWLRAPGSTATKPTRGKPLKAASQKHALMYGTELEPVLDLIAAMKDGKPIQVGFHTTSEDMERVFFGKIEMKEAESAQFAECFTAWSDALMKRLESARRPKE
jgi:hypothetical protein